MRPSDDKKMQDWLADKRAQREEKLRQESIQYFQEKIAEEIEGVKDCLDQGFFSIAKSKLERIEKFRNELVELNIY